MVIQRSAPMVMLAGTVAALGVACGHPRPAGPGASTGARVLALPAAGAVEGRVLWNEEPVAGARVYVTAEYNFASAHYGETRTDRAGHFVLTGVPSGQKYIYAFGNGPRYWVSAVTPFLMPPSGGTVAPDTYVCRGFDPASPTNGERLRTVRPVFRWDPYPEAVDYAVRVIRAGQTAFVFSRGDQDARLTSTTVQPDVDLTPGDYTWRVDAFNRHGHIIGCSHYPRPFGIVMAQTAPPQLPRLSSLSRDIDPDRHIHGIPLGTSVAQFVGGQGSPTGELHVSPSETVLLYGRSHAFSFEGDRLVGAWVRQNAYIVDFRLLERLTGSTPFDALGWRLTNGVESGMTLAEIKRLLGGNTLFACAPSAFPRCYFTTEKARVEFDLIRRGPQGGTGDEALVAVGVIVRATSFAAGTFKHELRSSEDPPCLFDSCMRSPRIGPPAVVPDSNSRATASVPWRRTYSVSDFKNKQAIVLAWFPKAYTLGCTLECKSLAEHGDLIKKFDVAYFMISVDPIDQNMAFAEQQHADFPLLSDPTKKTADGYGVLGAMGMASRWTFYIAKDGTIRWIDKDIKPATSAEDMAATLHELGVSTRGQ